LELTQRLWQQVHYSEKKSCQSEKGIANKIIINLIFIKMKKFLLCGFLLTTFLSFGQTVNVTDPETMISYRTQFVTTNEGQFGYLLDNIIATPIDVIATGELTGPIKLIRGPRDTGEITLANGQTVWVKVCAKNDDSWCGLQWVGIGSTN
jgi:hypothetical protein